MGKTTVAYILGSFPGGNPPFIINEIKSLQKEGVGIVVCPIHKQDLISRDETAEGIVALCTDAIFSPKIMAAHFYYLFRKPVLYFKLLLSNKVFGGRNVFWKGFYYARAIKKTDIRHIHAHFAWSSADCARLIHRLTDIPFSLTAHQSDIHRYPERLEGKLKEAKFILTCTKGNKHFLASKYSGDIGYKTYAIYHGVDPSKFLPEENSVKSIDILSIGDLIKCKGFEYLIKACGLLKNTDNHLCKRCVIVGKGEEKDNLTSLIHEMNLEDVIKISDPVSYEEVVDFYKKAKTFALPVTVINDAPHGIPNVLTEAMSMGLPTIATNVPDLSELIEDGKNGILVPDKNPEKMAEALRMVLSDHKLRQHFGKNARERIVRDFDLKKHAHEMSELFTEKIGQVDEVFVERRIEQRLANIPARLSHYVMPYIKPSCMNIILRDLCKLNNTIHSDSVHLKAAMDWLCRAQDITDCGGVSAYYAFDKGWAPPYPETTGYIIPTILKFARICGDGNYVDRAIRMADWEIEIQLTSGAVRGGIGINEYPMVFNTGQVIFGWAALYNETKIAKYLRAAEKAADWLVNMQDEDGKWNKYVYKDIPTVYHTRVAWSLIDVYKITRNKKYLNSAQKNIAWTLANSTKNGWFNKMAFNLGEQPLTHAISYTLEGLVGCSLYLLNGDKEKALSAVETALKSLILKYSLIENCRYLPATMDENWDSKVGFTCLVGNAQLSWVLLELYKISKEHVFLQAALNLIDLLKTRQKLDCKNLGIRGGIPGSYPIWGKYLQYSYPNWAAKFFADALISKNECCDPKNR